MSLFMWCLKFHSQLVQVVATRIAAVNTLRYAGSFDVQSDNVNIPRGIPSLRFLSMDDSLVSFSELDIKK